MTEGIVTPSVRNTDLTARGSGGRAIGYAEYGDPKGKPVLAFHGFGDSRLTRYPDDDLTARLGVRLITFDRPGIGRTDAMKALTILDRTDDVIDLVNSLGLQKFAILGWSGGAPFALAAAGCIPERVSRVAIAGGFGPFERPGFKRQAPKELRRVMTILKVAPWMSTVMATESEKQMKSGGGGGAMGMDSGLGSSSDASLLNASDISSMVTAGAEEAFRQGPAGIASDMLLLFRFKWGFNPEQVRRPVELFYGDDDHVTPVEVGKGLASILPDARLRTKPGAGHLLYLRYWEEILHTLIEEPEARVAVPTTTFVPPEAAPAPAAPVEEPEPVASNPAAFDQTPFQQAPSWWAMPEKAPEEPVAAEAAAPSPTDEAAVVPRLREEAAHAEATPEEAPREEAPPERRPAPSRSAADEIARLRAAGFLLDEPEPEPAEVSEAPLETAAETEAAPAVADVASVETLAAEPVEAAAAAPAEAEPVEAAAIESVAAESVEPAAAGPAEAERIEEAAAAPAEAAAATSAPAEAAPEATEAEPVAIESTAAEAAAPEPAAVEPEAEQPVTEAPVAAEPVAEAPAETEVKPRKARTTRPRTRKAKATKVAAEVAATEPAAEEAVAETTTAERSAEQPAPAQPAAETPAPEPVAQAEPVVETEPETLAAPEAGPGPLVDEAERLHAAGFGEVEAEVEAADELEPYEVVDAIAERAVETAEPAESQPLEPAADLTTAQPATEMGEPAAEAPAEHEPEPVEQPAATERGPEPVTAMAETPLRGGDEAVERLRAAGFLLPETESLPETSAGGSQTNGTATGASDDHDRLRAAGFALPGENRSASGVADAAPETAEQPAPSGWVSEEIAAVVDVPEEVVEPAPEITEPAASEPVGTQPAATEPVDAAQRSDEPGGEAEAEPPHTPEELAMIERLRAAGYLGIGR